jgi:hypothetical protein
VTDETTISRASFLVAGLLGLIGLARLGSDYLTDVNPTWVDALHHSWVRYVVRTASDGSFMANLNVQFFKVLAIPCGIAVAYYLNLVRAGGLRMADRSWQTPRARLLCVGSLWLLCTLIEVEKATHIFGLGLAGLLSGESAWKNHVVHFASAALGWLLMTRLRYRVNQ